MMKKVAIVLAYLLGALALIASRVLSMRVRKFEHASLIMPKLLVPATSSAVAASGLVAAALGLLAGSVPAFLLGSIGGAGAALYIWRLARARADFARAFGPGWESKISAQQASGMLGARWGWRLPSGPEPRFEQNVTFYTEVEEEGKQDGCTLLCDIWQPPVGVPPSGVALIYLHGSAWHYLDKDYLTRPIFGHLARQGHVVMDVAYRLCPGVDFFEMLGDVKRAVAWMKAHGAEYGVDPARIVLCGGSAGGHLALMSAYAPNHPALTPGTGDLGSSDLSVCAVISMYGPTDLRTTFQSGWALDTGIPIDSQASIDGEGEISRLERGDAANNRSNQQAAKLATGSSDLQMLSVRRIFTNLLGGVPAAVPEVYDLASPINHVSPTSPPTLLMHGSHDTLVPVDDARRLYRRLLGAGVPAIYVELPQTEHGFDLVHARYSPPARVALYHIERFLALVAVDADQSKEERTRDLLRTA